MAADDATTTESGRAISRAAADLQALRQIEQIRKLEASSSQIKNSFDGIQRSLSSATRQIRGQLREAAKGNVKDAAFHAISITREIAKINSLKSVKPDIDALANSSPAYGPQKEQWEQFVADGEREVARNLGRYYVKIRDLRTYPQEMRSQSFSDLQRESGGEELGRKLIHVIHMHVMAPEMPTREALLNDFRTLLKELN